jgi:hypothetical protein
MRPYQSNANNGFDRWFLAKKNDPSFIAEFRSYIKDARDRGVVPERTTLRDWALAQYKANPPSYPQKTFVLPGG